QLYVKLTLTAIAWRVAAHGGMGLWFLFALLNAVASTPAEVVWRISIAWEDEDCNSVCRYHNLACTEACWPLTAAGLESALSSNLQGTCFGVAAGSAQPWHPAKDAENTMCYWFAGHTASQSPRCAHKSATPTQLLDDAKVMRRLCPCISGNISAVAGIDCGLGGQPTDPAPANPGWVQEVPSTTAEPSTGGGQVPSLPGNTPSPAPVPVPPAPALPQVLQPAMVACQELCVSGFGAEDDKLNGQFARLSGNDGTLAFWLKLGGLPNGADCRLLRGADGVWRYYEVSSQANTSIGEGTLRTPAGEDIPQDDYVLTPTGGFQVEYRCCPQQLATTAAPRNSATPAEDDPMNTAITVALVAGGVVLVVSVVALCLIQRWKPNLLRSRKYQAFQDGASKVQPQPRFEVLEKPGAAAAEKAATWHQWNVTPKVQSQAVSSTPASASKVGGTWLPNKKNPDRSASAIADVLGKSSAMAAQDGIYEGPMRQWWGPGGAGGASSSGVGGTGFQLGDSVRLQGLTASAWNGLRGTVEGFDPQKGALEVNVDGRIKLVKPENCTAANGFRSAGEAELTPSQLRTQLNAVQVDNPPRGPAASSGP
ncbi:unnamed protein product, partial [Effrenium voratum]